MGDSKYNLAIARVTMDRALLQPESPDLPIPIANAHGILPSLDRGLAKTM
jgi:methyl-accepting chemotaxis protein I, serine sensor receptor